MSPPVPVLLAFYHSMNSQRSWIPAAGIHTAAQRCRIVPRPSTPNYSKPRAAPMGKEPADSRLAQFHSVLEFKPRCPTLSLEPVSSRHSLPIARAASKFCSFYLLRSMLTAAVCATTALVSCTCSDCAIPYSRILSPKEGRFYRSGSSFGDDL